MGRQEIEFGGLQFFLVSCMSLIGVCGMIVYIAATASQFPAPRTVDERVLLFSGYPAECGFTAAIGNVSATFTNDAFDRWSANWWYINWHYLLILNFALPPILYMVSASTQNCVASAVTVAICFLITACSVVLYGLLLGMSVGDFEEPTCKKQIIYKVADWAHPKSNLAPSSTAFQFFTYFLPAAWGLSIILGIVTCFASRDIARKVEEAEDDLDRNEDRKTFAREMGNRRGTKLLETDEETSSKKETIFDADSD